MHCCGTGLILHACSVNIICSKVIEIEYYNNSYNPLSLKLSYNELLKVKDSIVYLPPLYQLNRVTKFPYIQYKGSALLFEPRGVLLVVCRFGLIPEHF